LSATSSNGRLICAIVCARSNAIRSVAKSSVRSYYKRFWPMGTHPSALLL
jgi:hypothetical protein